MEAFDVSLTKATLGLTLYVLGKIMRSRYVRRALTCHRLISVRSWSHVSLTASRITPAIGLNPVYIGSLFIFVLFQLPIVLAKNSSTVLAFRFLTGFFGSPALPQEWVL